MNVDQLLAEPLPSPQQQAARLLQAVQGRVGDDRYRPAEVDARHLAAEVGVVDGEAVRQVAAHLIKKGQLEELEVLPWRIRLTVQGAQKLDDEPAATTESGRPQPRWAASLTDPILVQTLGEVYLALQSRSFMLAAAGARILIDRAIFLTVGDKGGFAKGLAAMKSKGFLTDRDQDAMLIMADAGSAASHRGWSPAPEQLHAILDGVEGLLHRAFVLDQSAADVKSATPPRLPKT